MDAGVCTIGDGFSCNTNCFISYTEKITFGHRCLLEWNVQVRDVDGHAVIINKGKKPSLRPIEIGNDV